jgi:uncharacterized protein YkwD
MNLKKFCATILSSACFSLAPTSISAQGIQAPPPAPPLITNEPVAKLKETSAPVVASATPVHFSIGDPTDEEQLYLELINRARADANAEATRLIALDEIHVQTALQQVDLNLMKAQFATNPPVGPLSFNAKLTQAARDHSLDMFNTGTQTHTGPGTNTLRERLQAVSYPFALAGENVYSYAENVEHGHAGFEVDWSNGTANGGMQVPPGHRNSIHNGRFTEVGIGVFFGRNEVPPNIPVGPQLVTQDFGLPNPALTYVTGVAYYDLNGNNFYDLGEGLSGVTVSIDGVTTNAITSASGGYSIPVASGKTYTVRFDASGAAQTTASATIANTNNVKVDYKPVFTPSAVVSAPSIVFTGVPNAFKFSTLGGATGYKARTFTLQAPVLEGAEGPLTNVTLTTFGNYQSVSTTVKATGAKSFHLGHVTDQSNGNAYPQLIQFVNPFYVKPNAKVDFKSRLGIAFAGDETGVGETARLQISIDEGKTWSNLWSQAGAEISGGPDNSEHTFNARSVSFNNYAGKLVQLRFNYDVNTTVGWFSLNGDTYGWYIDDISITGADEAVTPQITTLDASATFAFTPTTTGDYLLQGAGVAGSRQFPYGPLQIVNAQALPPPVYSLLKDATIANGTLSLRVDKVSGTTTPILLQSAPSPAGPWTVETGATISPLIRSQYMVTVPASAGARFYRVVAN